MAENFMSLGETIVEDLHLTDSEASGVDAAMSWLQMHQDQVPRLTITEAELEEAVDASGSLKEFAGRFGISVVPTAELTPAEQMLADLEGMNGDGFLLHNRHREIVAAQLTALGWVKEPSGEAEETTT